MTKSIWLLKLLNLKLIESQYITRSIQGRADELVIQAKELNYQTLFRVNCQIYHCSSMVLCKMGYVKAMRSINLWWLFQQTHFNSTKKKFGFREKYWFYNANLWHSFLVQDFLGSYKYAYKWVTLLWQSKYDFLNLCFS
jgi:hypothetical protein